MVHREELDVERPERDAIALGHLGELDVAEAVLAQLLTQEPERERAADDGDRLPLAQEVRDRADVVLVAVRQDQSDDIVQPIRDRIEARQDEVDAGVVVLGEQHAAVDEEELAVDLEARHVPAHVAETAERDHPECVVGESGRGTQTGIRHSPTLVAR